MKNKERFTLPLFNLANMTLKTYKTAKPYQKKLTSPQMNTSFKKNQKEEKQKLFKSQTLTKEAVIGVKNKIKDIIGSYKFIISISSRSILEEQTEYSSQWLALFKQERQSSVEAIIKKWKRNTNIFQKY
jgi:hypothetical protein